MDGQQEHLNPFRDDSEHTSQFPTIELSMEPGPNQSSGTAQSRKGKKIVGFSNGSETIDTQERPRSFLALDVAEPPRSTPGHSRQTSASDLAQILDIDKSHLPELSQEITNELRAALGATPIEPARPRPVLRRGESTTPQNELSGETSAGHRTPQELRAAQAYERGKRLERREMIRSGQASRRSSPIREAKSEDIPLIEISQQDHNASAVESDSEGEGLTMKRRKEQDNAPTTWEKEAKKLVRSHTLRGNLTITPPAEMRSGAVTPTEISDGYEFHAPQPAQMRGGVLGALLSLYGTDTKKSPAGSRRSSFGWDSNQTTPAQSNSPSEPSTPRDKPKRPLFGKRTTSTNSIAKLVTSASIGASPAVSGLGAEVAHRLKEREAVEKALRKRKAGSTTSLLGLVGSSKSKEKEKQHRITIHIAETIARHRYLEKLCRALMEYGAPTHRLEEYMKMTARVLEVPAQFLYIPGCMLISFDDPQTHTASVRLVRVNQGLDLGKLRDVHELYKEVVHDSVGVEEATIRLAEITQRKPKFNKWLIIIMYGFASASVGPFAFGARLIDLPIAFLLGSLVGLLQQHVAPRSELYSNVFEVSAAVLTSFLARAFGSINGGTLFCFSALAQSSIALILPGYIVLCASLELQSRSIVAGSVRMVYAIIYSLFLGFGIMIGVVLYGRIDENATSATTCQNSIQAPYTFLSVPIFTICLIIVNQGKYKQIPVMLVISFAGYIVNHYSSTRFAANTQIASVLGALAIGVLANLYSRIGKRCENWCLDVWEDRLVPSLHKLGERLGMASRNSSLAQYALEEGDSGWSSDKADGGKHAKLLKKRPRKVGYGLAAAAMLPAIFVQVPSGLAVGGSLLAGVISADAINSNTTTTTTAGTTQIGLDSVAFNVSYSVVQVAIGITVGLFLAAVVVYPTGKRRSGLFSF